MRGRSFEEAFLDVINGNYREYCKTVSPREEKRFLGMVLIKHHSAVWHPLGFFRTKCTRILKIPWKPNLIQRLIANLCEKPRIVSFVTQGWID